MSLAKLDSLVVATIPDAMRLVVVRNCVVALVHCWNNFDALVAYHRRQKFSVEIRDADGLCQLSVHNATQKSSDCGSTQTYRLASECRSFKARAVEDARWAADTLRRHMI